VSHELVDRFYTGFAARDADVMAACYHADVRFEDPVFGELHGPDAGDMWRMLCANATDLRVEHEVEAADDAGATVRWTARYTFSATGRPVRNDIVATMKFRDGKIVDHRDEFSLWRWCSQALGLPGKLAGWSPPMQSRVRATARKGLDRYRAAKSD
jgi:ketosteroid isomerase-like protein